MDINCLARTSPRKASQSIVLREGLIAASAVLYYVGERRHGLASGWPNHMKSDHGR